MSRLARLNALLALPALLAGAAACKVKTTEKLDTLAVPAASVALVPSGVSIGCGRTGQPTGELHLAAPDGRGRQRRYDLLVPEPYDSTLPLALVLVAHGAGGDIAIAKGFGVQDAPGARMAAVFAFPQGIEFQNHGVGWDDTCGGYDMPFFDALVSAVETNYCIDGKRLFVAGFSWGGDYATALACCRGDKLRAIAPASSTDEYANPTDYRTYSNAPCPGHGAVGIRFTHDASGGDSAYARPLFDTTSALFRSFNGCSASASPVVPAGCQSFAGCASPYIECRHSGLGHNVPAGWGNDTWAFFAGFR